ncbi:Os09g0130300, partial [Oryza sativa Japonica Group]
RHHAFRPALLPLPLLTRLLPPYLRRRHGHTRRPQPSSSITTGVFFPFSFFPREGYREGVQEEEGKEKQSNVEEFQRFRKLGKFVASYAASDSQSRPWERRW